MENRNRQVLLKRRPTGAPTPADFEITDAPLPDRDAYTRPWSTPATHVVQSPEL